MKITGLPQLAARTPVSETSFANNQVMMVQIVRKLPDSADSTQNQYLIRTPQGELAAESHIAFNMGDRLTVQVADIGENRLEFKLLSYESVAPVPEKEIVAFLKETGLSTFQIQALLSFRKNLPLLSDSLSALARLVAPLTQNNQKLVSETALLLQQLVKSLQMKGENADELFESLKSFLQALPESEENLLLARQFLKSIPSPLLSELSEPLTRLLEHVLSQNLANELRNAESGSAAVFFLQIPFPFQGSLSALELKVTNEKDETGKNSACFLHFFVEPKPLGLLECLVHAQNRSLSIQFGTEQNAAAVYLKTGLEELQGHIQKAGYQVQEISVLKKENLHDLRLRFRESAAYLPAKHVNVKA